jgi:Ca2+-binding EF-hand superfamily protein
MFEHFDKDRSGTIDVSELQGVMTQIGEKLPPQLVTLLVAKFGTFGGSAPKHSSPVLFFLTTTVASSPSGSHVGEQTITFDRFIRACVFARKFKESFSNLDMDKDGRVHLNYQQCMKLYLMLP